MLQISCGLGLALAKYVNKNQYAVSCIYYLIMVRLGADGWKCNAVTTIRHTEADNFKGIVDMLSAQHRMLTSSHDANVPFGMEVPLGNRKNVIQRHKLYLKIQDGGWRPSWKWCTIHSQGTNHLACCMFHFYVISLDLTINCTQNAKLMQ